jgi:hypothetical protein
MEVLSLVVGMGGVRKGEMRFPGIGLTQERRKW